MESLHIHELHKVINDLTAKQQYQLAFELCSTYLEKFDDGYLIYCYLTLPWRMGRLDQTIELLTAAIDDQTWISPWMINQFNLFADFRDDAKFQALLTRLEACEKAYWESDHWKPITSHPPNETASPLLIGLHGGGLHAEHSAEKWAPAEELGWLTTHPNSPNIIGHKQHWWMEIDHSKRVVYDQLEQIQNGYLIDPDQILVCGFSSGGQVALHLALEGKIGAKGFILVGTGGQYFNKPREYWRPLMEQAPAGLRGALFYSDYDMERSGNDVERLLDLFEEYSIEVQFNRLSIAGHDFPPDFKSDLEKAIQFIF